MPVLDDIKHASDFKKLFEQYKERVGHMYAITEGRFLEITGVNVRTHPLFFDNSIFDRGLDYRQNAERAPNNPDLIYFTPQGFCKALAVLRALASPPKAKPKPLPKPKGPLRKGTINAPKHPNIYAVYIPERHTICHNLDCAEGSNIIKIV